MIIHVVAEGDTIESIARYYGVSVERLTLMNGIRVSDNLVIGEILVVLIPEIEHTVQDGDTLESIAAAYNVTVFELLRNNPYLSGRSFIYPGEVIVIKYEGEKIGSLTTNGYAYPFIGLNTLRKALPFLTYLSIYTYYYDMSGEIHNINDENIIRTAKEYGVAPVMILSPRADDPIEENELINYVLRNPDVQDQLISNLLNLLTIKEYYGVKFSVRYVQPEDRPLYIEFIKKLSTRIQTGGFKTFVTLPFNVFELLTNVTYPDIQLELLVDYVEYINMLTYDWGFAYIAPSVVAFDTVRNLLDKITDQIPPEKINFGISTIGYIWRLPYIECITTGQSLTFSSAIELAREFNVEIQYDDVTNASYFQYYSDYEYIVRFRDARGIDDILSLMSQYNIRSLGIWNIMYFFDQMWMVVNSQYNIEKIYTLSETT